MKKIFNSRFALLASFIITYLLLSFLVRTVLYILTFHDLDFSLVSLFKIYGFGLYFDLAVSLFFGLMYAVYLWVLPSRFIGSIVDKVITYFIMSIVLFLSIFGFLGEFPFWDEFSHRYNFIAVDYLIYTYEVVQNINQSYPIPLILSFQIALIFLLFYSYSKFGALHATFGEKTRFLKRTLVVIPLLLATLFFGVFANNKQAQWSGNTYDNELSKNGVFSLFAAYNSNQLDYASFYKTIPDQEAYALLKKDLKQDDQSYMGKNYDSITRQIKCEGTETRPNIVLITIESLSADFLGVFGNEKGITPNLDALANESFLFTHMYATGTRTVRGMEALTLCVPPTPGQSIVRRPNNENLFSIASILKEKNYHLSFIYGGDGYFDNMNYFFGSQGFDIIDRNRGSLLSENVKTTRYSIPDEEVTFENAWGICDGDIYEQALREANRRAMENRPFFQFIMTTSNHKPFTFPQNTIDLPNGSRDAAVKYTDYALGKFLEQAKAKEWFKNTVFVIVADHCASSAGRWEINISKHLIPAMVYNLDGHHEHINKIVSQIDLVPTVFGLLNWSYATELYGKNAVLMHPWEERALLGNYRTLGLLKGPIFTQLNDHRQIEQFQWNPETKTMAALNKPIDSLQDLTVSYYQTASERFKNGKMKE